MQDPGRSYRQTALKGATVTGVAQLFKVGLQVTSTVVLSRLLAPADFGIVAMVTPIVAFVSLFQDLGLQQAIVQARDVSAEQISRMFWINFGMSCVVGLFLVLISPAVGWFYNEPKVVSLTALWSIPLLLSAISSQHYAILNRNLRFSTISFIDVSSASIALFTAFIFAWKLGNFWALWLSVVAGAITTTALAWKATGWRPSGPRVKAETGHMMRFGLNLAGFNFMNYFARNLDNVIIAKAFGSGPLGLYDRSYKLLLAPLANINTPVSRVMLPILARLRDEPSRYREAYLQAAGLVAWVCVPGIGALAIVAHDFVPLLLGDRWSAAAPIFAWLGLAGICQPLSNATGWLFTTQHRTQQMFRWGIFSSFSTVLSFFIGLPWGVTGVAASYALSTVFLRQPILFFWVGKKGTVTTTDLFLIQMPVTVSMVICFFFLKFVNEKLDLSRIENTMLSLIVSYAFAFIIILVIKPTRKILLKSLSNVLSGMKSARMS